MKKFTIFVVVAIVAIAIFNDAACYAQQVKSLRSPLVVILDFKEASDKSDFGKMELAKINAKLEVHKAAVEKKQKYINNLFAKLQEPGQTSVTQEFYNAELRTAQRFVEDTNLELAELNKQLTNTINTYMKKAVMAYAREKKYDIVLPSQSVYTVYEPYNITRDFINYLNKEYKNE